MLPCNSKKTGYTSYKTLSHVIKCIFLMCAFLFIGLFNANDKVEAASIAYHKMGNQWDSKYRNWEATRYFTKASDTQINQTKVFSNWETPYDGYPIAMYKLTADKRANSVSVYNTSGTEAFTAKISGSYQTGYVTFYLFSYQSRDYDPDQDGLGATQRTYSGGEEWWSCSEQTNGIFDCGIGLTDFYITNNSSVKVKLNYTYEDCFLFFCSDKTSSVEKTIKFVDKAPLGTYNYYYNTYSNTLESEGWYEYSYPDLDEHYRSDTNKYYVNSVYYVTVSGNWYDSHYTTGSYCINESSSYSGCTWTSFNFDSHPDINVEYKMATNMKVNRTICLHSKDAYGNISTDSYVNCMDVVVDQDYPYGWTNSCTTASGTSISCDGQWTNQDVTYRISGAKDDTAGFGDYRVKTYRYRKKGTTEWLSNWKGSSSAEAYITFTEEGTNTYEILICDGTGNCSGDEIVIKIDKTAPIATAFTLKGGATYTNTTSISATASATDNLSGVKSYSISGDCTPNPKTGNFSKTSTSISGEIISNITLTSANGTKTLTITVTDAAGNVGTSTTKSDSIILDTVAPTVSAFTLTGNSSAASGYTNTGTITGKVTGTDNLSGIVSYSIKGNCTDKTGTMTATTSISNYSISSISLSTSSQGTKTLTITLTDAAGNVSTGKSTSIVYDNVNPVISKFVVRGNENATCGTTSGYTNTTSITYVNGCTSTSNLEASDATAGIRYYKVEDGTSVIYAQSATKPTSDTLANTNTGNHTITLTITDNAGNVQTKTYTIYYDPGTPTASKFNVTGNSGATAGYTNIRNVAISIEASDALSGIREYIVKDGGTTIANTKYTDSPFLSPRSGILATATQGTHTLTLKVIDYAGNEFLTTTSTTVKPFNIILDTTAPVISSFTYTGNANAMSGYTNQQAISYTLNVTDTYFKSGSITPKNTSGTACSANAKSVTSKSSSGSINLCDTTNGTHQLIVSAVDHAGNAASAATSYNIIMDTVAPVLDLTTTLSPSLPAKNGTATITYTEKYPRVTMTGQTLRYALATDATSSANMTCTVVTSTTLTQTNCFGSSALANTATDVYSITITLSPTTSGTYYLRVVDENLAMDRAGNAATSPVSKVNMIVNEETVSTYVFGGYLIDQTAPTVSLTLGNGSYNGSGTSTIHYSKTGASITVKFTDNMYLYQYSSTSYYRYCWSTTTTCSTYTAISGTRSKTEVSGSVTVPSTIGTHYLIIAGTERDYAGWYTTNSYLVTARSSTSTGTRVFKFVTDNTVGSLTIGHTKVLGGDNKYTYYAKPGITASVNYTDNTALRGYANTNNHMYAWSTSATTISGWSDTYLNTMPSKSLKNIGGIKTPTTEGTWYLMLYSQSTDAAGNTISTPSTYGTATVQYKMLWWYNNATVKVYKFIIDGTSPELVLKSESGENTYYKTEFDENNEPINPITELKVGDTVSIGYEEAHGYAASNDAVIYYYISTEKDADNKVNFANAISNGLAGLVDDNHKITFASNVTIMNNPEGYYLYLYIQVGESTYVKYGYDYARNELSSNYDGCVSIYGDDYLVVKFFIEPIELESDEEDEAITNIKDNVKDVITSPSDYGFIDNSAYIVIAQDGVMTNIKNNINKIVTNLRDYQTYIVVDETTGNIESAFLQESTTGNALQVQKDTNNENNYIWIYTINNVVRNPADAVSINGAIVPEIIAKFKIPFGIQKVLSAYDSNDTIIDSSKIYPEISIILDNGSPINVTLVIFNNSFIAVKNDNTATNIVVNQGEEIANVGMSFNSKDGSEVSVDTLITLDGVKVKNVDTNIPGVYNVTQVAKDKLGRTTRVNKEIVVLANKEVKEEVVEEEIIEAVEEVVVLPVEVKVNNEKVEEVKVVEVEQNRVEVKLENKVKVNGYKKRKEIRKNKKEQFSFKLFSKYFFKVYDG